MSSPEEMAGREAEVAGLTFREGVAVMKALARGQEENGGRGFTDAELVKAIEAVRVLRVHGVLAMMVLKGEMHMQIGDDGVVRYLTAPDFEPSS